MIEPHNDSDQSDDERWTVITFSQSNPSGDGQGDEPALLRRVAGSIEDLGEADAQDIVFHSEVTDGEDDLMMTVYYYRRSRRRWAPFPTRMQTVPHPGVQGGGAAQSLGRGGRGRSSLRQLLQNTTGYCARSRTSSPRSATRRSRRSRSAPMAIAAAIMAGSSNSRVRSLARRVKLEQGSSRVHRSGGWAWRGACGHGSLGCWRGQRSRVSSSISPMSTISEPCAHGRSSRRRRKSGRDGAG